MRWEISQFLERDASYLQQIPHSRKTARLQQTMNQRWPPSQEGATENSLISTQTLPLRVISHAGDSRRFCAAAGGAALRDGHCTPTSTCPAWPLFPPVRQTASCRVSLSERLPKLCPKDDIKVWCGERSFSERQKPNCPRLRSLSRNLIEFCCIDQLQ